MKGAASAVTSLVGYLVGRSVKGLIVDYRIHTGVDKILEQRSQQNLPITVPEFDAIRQAEIDRVGSGLFKKIEYATLTAGSELLKSLAKNKS